MFPYESEFTLHKLAEDKIREALKTVQYAEGSPSLGRNTAIVLAFAAGFLTSWLWFGGPR
ncbi:MAG: hypothetical protein M1299_04495 [Firmicutes bacterium]|nr:hypothetical protein [Bacillota bacterium]MCL5039074.1 hypothetical protein [Bacillota bacterium]